MAMENGPFIGDFPINTSIHRELSIAMFDSQRTFWLISEAARSPALVS